MTEQNETKQSNKRNSIKIENQQATNIVKPRNFGFNMRKEYQLSNRYIDNFQELVKEQEQQNQV